MANSDDNFKGLVLAISSSVFIGSSFIVKKKGLRAAGAQGIRAGRSTKKLQQPFRYDIVHQNFYIMHASDAMLHHASAATCLACRAIEHSVVIEI